MRNGTRYGGKFLPASMLFDAGPVLRSDPTSGAGSKLPEELRTGVNALKAGYRWGTVELGGVPGDRYLSMG